MGLGGTGGAAVLVRIDAQRPAAYLFGVSESVDSPLPPRARATLAAVARRVVPHAFADPDRGERLLAALLQRIAGLSPRKRRDLTGALTILGSRLAALSAGLAPRPFHELTPAAQDRLLEDWANARIPLLRTILQSVRRLVLLVEYSSAPAQREIGYRGAYHDREPAVSWEGALRGTPSDAEPVARASEPAAAHHPPPARARLTALVLDGSTLRADAVVIGSGAGGAVAAARLAESGLDVLILESGELLSGPDFDEREGPLYARLYADGGLRTSDDVGLSIVQGISAGGSTTVNWMVMLRTPEWVLEEWATDFGAEGMRASDLSKVFDRIEGETHTRLVPDDAHSPNNRIILDGARALGWSAFAANINASGCVRTGFCGYGCRVGAKQGMLQTYLPRAERAGARFVAHASARRIEFAERGGGRGARFPLKRVSVRYAPPGAQARDIAIEAPIVVVAGGAIETPALLQRSGLGGGGVGRFLRVHPVSGVLGFYEREIYGATGIPLTAVCDEYLRMDSAGYGAWIECPPLHPGIGAASLPGIGTAHREVMLRFRNVGSLIVLTRDGADRGRSNGEVNVRRDDSISIKYRLGRTDAAHLEAGLVAAARLHFAAGATEVRSGHTRPVVLRSPGEVDRLRGRSLAPNDVALHSAHVNGTCRLGVDARIAGTDPHGERFGAPGVFVVDGSLLPTALGVNPQETIMALATVIAERVAERWSPG